ncbi:putative death-receptor fusion protein-domain-containing protein [Morchella snyderi]|nr:putative death-receptor fusion protein-domain-containing protein [Morchella snyderi]
MSTAAETTVTALRELLPQHTPPLAEDVLRAVRAVLIRKPQNGVAAATATATATDTDTDTSTEAGKDVNILTALLRTAQTPTLTQPHRALACDALSTYLIRTRTPPHLPLPPTTTWADAAAAIVLAHFDDAQSPLSKALKDLLGNVLGAHPDPPAFARGLLAARVLPRLLGEGRAAGKAVYFVLEALVRRGLAGAGFVFGAFPGGGEARVVGALLGAVGDRTVAPVVGKALVALLGARRAEIEGVEGEWEEEWVRGWRGALECALGEEALRGNVVTYVLPGLFRLSPAGFRVFVEGLGFGRYCGGEEESVVVMEAAGDDGEKKGLMSLLCCLKVGKDLGYVAEETDADAAAAREGCTNNTNPTKLTVPTAFAAPLLAHPHPHLRLAAFTLLTHTPSPTTPLPSAALAAIRAALPHLHTETDAEVRNLTTQAIRALLERLAASSHHLTKLPPRTAEAKIQETATFMQWYLHTLTAQLAPPASYQRTTTALKLLTTLHLSGLGHPRSTPTPPPDPKKHLNWPAAVLAATAPLFTPALRRALADALFNPFDDVRAMAGALLLCAPPDHAALETLFAAAVARMNGTGRERDADGAARVVVLLFVAQGGEVVERVLGMLEGCVDAARRDFGAAVRARPVHGLLAGLRMVFERRGVWEGGAVGRGVVERVVAVCAAVWGVVRGVLCVDSPEGSGAAGVGEEEEGGEVDSQTVMSYSWRAVKEASALLATLLSHAPYDPTSPATSLLQHSDFSPAGDLLLSQLSHMRHRGAFSAVSPSFTTLCTTCITSRDPALHPLPASWLAANLHLITTSSSKITRRSAGLPFLLLAVLASERDPARPLLQSTFSHLAAIAARPPPPDTTHGHGNADKIDLPQVHALNCIKHLFTDARLSAAVAPHVGEALALAVACFAAPVWALRNCGIMLFTALLTRLVGVRGRSDSNGGGGGGGGALDARGFFERYPSARQVLLGGLAGSLDALDAGGALVEMVYPALSLVARLEYSPGFDGEVAGFVGCVRVAMGCRVWKVREMAARAYVSLVGGPEWRGVVEGLLREAGSREVGTNGAHGRLCAVRVLLERKARRGEEDLTAVWAAMDAVFGALVDRNRCAVIKAVCLQIITDHGLVTGALAEADALHGKVLSYASTAEIALAEINNAGVVGRTLFKTHLTAFMVARALHHPPTPTGITELLTLLSSRDEEAALSTAEHLLSSPHQLPLTPREAALLDTTLWTLITEHPWHQLRTAALTLLTRYGTSSTTALEPHWRATLDLATTPPTEPCQHAALAALGLLTAHIWAHYQHIPDGAQWAEWALAQLLALVAASLHEDQPYPAREAALLALKALAPVLRFDALAQWRSRPVALRGAYLALYALLNDDDEDLRDGAAEAVCRLLPGRAVAYMPLRAGEALLEAMVAAFCGEEEFFGDVVERAGGGVEVRGGLERLLGAAGTILFAREKQNLFVDGGVEARRWGGVLAAVGVQGGGRDFVLWVVAGLDAFEGKVRERGREGPLGWLADEEVFVLGVRVVEGVRVVRRWWERGEVEHVLWGMVVKGAEGLVAALEEVAGHEALKEGLREILHG